MKAKKKFEGIERLLAAAIVRDGKVHERGFKSHWQLRAALDPNAASHTMSVDGDVEGFITSSGRFVDRREARDVAIACGQIGPMWKDATRPLLSSDINW